MTMSNRLAVMRHGKIEQIGAPKDVYENPGTEFVAGFLGASNLLDGEVKDRSGAMAMVTIEGGSTLRVPVERVNAPESTVRVGVRPEKVHVRRENAPADGDGWNSVAGTLRVVTFIGVSHQFTVEGPGGKTLTAYAQNLGAEEPPTQGERIKLVWRPEHTFVVKPSEPLAEWEEAQ
jgi:spermidine/putrescine transport system ATP-binding protein